MINLMTEGSLQEITVDSGTTLLKEGDIVQKMFFIRQGCLRLWFNHQGKDITVQFFFEGAAATSLESFLHREPSPFSIETIEPCRIGVLLKSDFHRLLEDPAFKDWFYQTALEKLFVHSKRLLSMVRDKPEERYRRLLDEEPRLPQRVPQHYIASYLGITPVSLSRIRSRRSRIN
jgi:CRP-like cAMP-binding protein